MLLCVRAVISLHGRCGPSVSVICAVWMVALLTTAPFSHREPCASRLSFLMRERIFFLLPKSLLGGRSKYRPLTRLGVFEAGEKDAVMLMEKIKNDGFALKPKIVDTDGRSPTGTRFPIQAVLQSQKQAPSS